jgi:hypothetical protein
MIPKEPMVAVSCSFQEKSTHHHCGRFQQLPSAVNHLFVTLTAHLPKVHPAKAARRQGGFGGGNGSGLGVSFNLLAFFMSFGLLETLVISLSSAKRFQF